MGFPVGSITVQSCSSSTVCHVSGGIRRSRFLRSLGGALIAVVAAPGAAARGAGALLAHWCCRRGTSAAATPATAPVRHRAPGVAGRDTAAVQFGLDRAATVKLEAVRTALRKSSVVWEAEATLGKGLHELHWTPDPATPVGSYVMRLTLGGPRDRQTILGGRRPASVARQQAAVVRVLGVEAAFLRRSYLPGETMELRILADAAALTLQFLHCGAEAESTDRSDEMKGAPMGDPVVLDWNGKRSGPVTIGVQSGDWPTGLYAARLMTEDGRIGFAPFILRPKSLGANRQLCVLPTNTWQAYNFYDGDGDGWGDTWYAGGSPPVDLERPYRDRGVPPRYKRYDLGYLRWLQRTGKAPDIVGDDDLEGFASGDELRSLYDLVVFPGHSEYMTAHAYDVVERYRDLGGRLIFLSANNFFWKVEKQGATMRRVRLWRNDGRPEARLCGVQYRANDDGTRQGPFFVIAADAAPWLFEGTGLANGSTFGERSAATGSRSTRRPWTHRRERGVARVTDLFGPGLNGEMTYYETPAGARVFAAGVLDFGGSVTFWPVRRMLDNLWHHMLQDLPVTGTGAAAPAAAPGGVGTRP